MAPRSFGTKLAINVRAPHHTRLESFLRFHLVAFHEQLKLTTSKCIVRVISSHLAVNGDGVLLGACSPYKHLHAVLLHMHGPHTHTNGRHSLTQRVPYSLCVGGYSRGRICRSYNQSKVHRNRPYIYISPYLYHESELSQALLVAHWEGPNSHFVSMDSPHLDWSSQSNFAIEGVRTVNMPPQPLMLVVMIANLVVRCGRTPARERGFKWLKCFLSVPSIII